MRRMYRTVLIAGLVALAPVLAGCADFDMDSLDVFDLNEKKKLPGERKEVFPGGVPGVTQGIPPEYLKGNQQQADTALTPDAAAAPPAGANPPPAGQDRRDRAGGASPNRKRSASRSRARRQPAPTQVTVQPAPQGQGSGEQKLEPWPGTAPQQQPRRPRKATIRWLSRAAAAQHRCRADPSCPLAASRQRG